MSETDFHVRLTKDACKKLKDLAEERGVSQRRVIASAVDEYLSGGKEVDVDLLRKEIFELKRRLSALRGDVEILGELLSFYIYNWLGYMPKLEKAERTSLAVEAKERHKRFMEMFAKKVTLGELNVASVLTRSKPLSEEEA